MRAKGRDSDPLAASLPSSLGRRVRCRRICRGERRRRRRRQDDDGVSGVEVSAVAVENGAGVRLGPFDLMCPSPGSVPCSARTARARARAEGRARPSSGAGHIIDTHASVGCGGKRRTDGTPVASNRGGCLHGHVRNTPHGPPGLAAQGKRCASYSVHTRLSR